MQPTRVLVVDDDPAICEFVTALLLDEGYAVVSAPHGAAALQLLAGYQPDIILLDLQMPVMDGRTFLQRYAQTPGAAARVVVMSAARDLQRLVAQSPTVAVIEKPFQITDLLDLLAQQVPLE